VTAASPALAGVAAGAGAVELCLPADWCEILVDDDDDDARAHVERVIRETWPTCPEHLRAGSAELLLRWREDLLARGAVSHGLVNAWSADGAPVRWHVLTSVVPLPVAADVDLTSVLTRLVTTTGRDLLHVERFETDMGLGFGLIAQPEVAAPDLGTVPFAPADGRGRLGAAAALSYTPGTGLGLLVVGMSASPDQVLELAGLVAVMAGRSRLHLPSEAPSAEMRMQA
jgi:hypothetical protein